MLLYPSTEPKGLTGSFPVRSDVCMYERTCVCVRKLLIHNENTNQHCCRYFYSFIITAIYILLVYFLNEITEQVLYYPHFINKEIKARKLK